MLRFDAYRMKRDEDLANPATLDKRWADIDYRIALRENDAVDIQNAINNLIAVGLQRLNDTFTPLILQAQTQLSNFGVLFEAASDSSVLIGTGTKNFVLTEATRAGWVHVNYINASVATDSSKSVIGRVVSYARDTGLLVVDVELTQGAGTFDDWAINVSVKPDAAHATRTDNPHATTAAQVGTYSTLELDAIFAALAPKSGAVLTGAKANTPGPGSDVTSVANLQAVSALITAALAGSPDISAVLIALDGRLSFAGGQGLSPTQKDQALSNLGVAAAIRAFILAADITAARAAIGANNAANLNAGTIPNARLALTGAMINAALGYTAAQYGGGVNQFVNNANYAVNGQGVSAFANDAGYKTAASAGDFDGNIDSGSGTYYFFHNPGLLIQYRTDIGALYTPNNFQVGGVKAFRIPHPAKPYHDLVHVCLEGPEAAVFYRGRGVAYGGDPAEIVLPAYFSALVDEASATIQVTPVMSMRGRDRAAPLTVTEIRNGRFLVYPGDYREEQHFHWRVEAVRKDVAPIEVEPVRTSPDD